MNDESASYQLPAWQVNVPEFGTVAKWVVGSIAAWIVLDAILDPADYYNYDLVEGRKVVYKGQTNCPERRLEEHVASGKLFTHMRLLGPPNKLSEARRLEVQAIGSYMRNHKGLRPKYNLTNHG